ncbi:hypothetical protein [Terricaulis sp.]|uniref:hypothetical protein n=1 Tax=Terricaulis sp. TaxID=2768686 RepID=UPI003784536A
MRHLLAAAALFAITACASSSEPGWTGDDAKPFDAKASCQIETQTVDGPDFERCMASSGWTRIR